YSDLPTSRVLRDLKLSRDVPVTGEPAIARVFAEGVSLGDQADRGPWRPADALVFAGNIPISRGL
ncbi:MAG TPA: hypothetical protein DDZ88_24010, partial [Verrucomicrobiales bacterium]|nr:hypothetical protein [Verrucomicrobiales bacterium]